MLSRGTHPENAYDFIYSDKMTLRGVMVRLAESSAEFYDRFCVEGRTDKEIYDFLDEQHEMLRDTLHEIDKKLYP